MTPDARLATLEEKAIQAEKSRATIHKKLSDQDEDLKAIRSDVHAIKEQIYGFRGFWTGMLFAISSVAAIIGGAVAAAWNKVFS